MATHGAHPTFSCHGTEAATVHTHTGQHAQWQAQFNVHCGSATSGLVISGHVAGQGAHIGSHDVSVGWQRNF